MLAVNTLSGRKFSLTVRQLYLAAQIEPSLWWSPWAYVILASSVFGRRVFDMAVDFRSR